MNIAQNYYVQVYTTLKIYNNNDKEMPKVMLKQMYDIIEPYICPNCGNNVIVFETRKNTSIDYKSILRGGISASEMKQELQKRSVKGFRCLYCGHRFLIDYTKVWPSPLYRTSESIKYFNKTPKNTDTVIDWSKYLVE